MEGWFCVVLMLAVPSTITVVSLSITSASPNTTDCTSPAVLTTTAVHVNARSVNKQTPASTANIIIGLQRPAGTMESSPPLTVPRSSPTVDPLTNDPTTTFNKYTITEGQTTEEHSTAPQFTTAEGRPTTLSTPEATTAWLAATTLSLQTTVSSTADQISTFSKTTTADSQATTTPNLATKETTRTAPPSTTADTTTGDTTTEPTETIPLWTTSVTDTATATPIPTTTTLWTTPMIDYTDFGTTQFTSVFPSDSPATTPIPTATTTTTPDTTTTTSPTTSTPTTLWTTPMIDYTDFATTQFTSVFPSDSPATTPIPTTTTATTPDTTTTTSPTTPTTTTTTPTTTTTTRPTTKTPTITTSTPTTAAPLNCSNGDKVGGVCICPDEWTGETCSEVNFCHETTLNGFRFPNTTSGWFAYSNEICPKETSGAGTPRASTRCSSRGGTPEFDPPQVLECEQTLKDIQKNLTSLADLEILASSTQLLTSRPGDLTAENITVAAQIANTLLLSPNTSESVRVAAVATVSQLLNATKSQEMEESNTTQSLTLTLDQLSLNLSLTNNTSQVVQPNLVVQSAQIVASDTQGVQFTAFAGLSGSFVANRIQLNTNVSKVTVDNGFIADALVHIRFPSEGGVEGSQQRPNVSLGFVLYQNNRFFPSRLYRRQQARVRVLSASIGGPERSVVPQSVEMHFRITRPDKTSLHDFSCVFWDYGQQDWSTQGCSKGNASDGVLRCLCNHTTNFAALWSFRENYEYAETLGVISIVGLAFSLLGLVVTIIHHLRENFQKKPRNQQTKLNSKVSLLCIYLSLLAFIITFLSGVQNSSPQNSTMEEPSDQNHIPASDRHVEPDRGSCTAVAALLHFFLLATFSWNSVYGTQLVLLVRSMHRSLPPYWTPLSLGVGWGVPAVVMVITLAATYRVENPLGYRQEEFCWLAALDLDKHFSFGKPMFWAFLLPVGLVLIYNTVLLVLTSLTTCRVDRQLTSTRSSSLNKRFLVSFSLAVLLGLSWTLGYFVLVTKETPHLIFSILFCLCTATQGLQIFIFFTARTQSFKASMWKSMHYIRSASIPSNSTKYYLWRNSRKTNSSETYRDIMDQDTSV
ncbi:adhesion G-protein coupled receptor G7 isoform X2 [Girardinichthys multiradiatus]|uniref:adhesion G-protein coupled receptor G7 isoform X2 n=1 Tax=Girardinichthys multiradiatus TaxID=208333 RepID=UPI001FAC5D22|nr:adhesion G-protein coupled receptor G7 isoform X2 [Girardinichthys multiradiatus]